ncbi:DUF1330 domain-containing protein [Sphingorhabdus sp. EL138]|uniref:DUF1330 domain-containing protein n=1 Tax=Sphingorhabdus sp. EL138 TaxID=2073156 RepID=UPI0013A56CC2|nr:DUF1330 domain-containing protein [Sphingorhabdus sp. EL138]
MAAYMLITAHVSDWPKFREGYSLATAELVRKYGGKYILIARDAKLLEGAFGENAAFVISQWPDLEAAKKFWDSPEYQMLKKKREQISDCQVLLVEGELSGAR